MKKDAYYFSHDANARNDPKLVALRNIYKMTGYGQYWVIVEMLRESANYKLPMKPYIYIALADEFCCDQDQVESFIEVCIKDFELFQTDGENLWSERLLRSMKLREEKSRKASEAAKQRYQGDTEHTHSERAETHSERAETHSDSMQGKERKGKKSKGKEIKEKENVFRSRVLTYADKYPIEMLQEFLGYWTEPNKSGTKMRYEMEKTWDLGRRLGRWSANQSEFQKRKKGAFPDYYDTKFFAGLHDGEKITAYYRHLRSLGLQPKKDRSGQVVDWVPAGQVQKEISPGPLQKLVEDATKRKGQGV